MFETDLEKLDIKYISWQEIINTGADPLLVQAETIYRANKVRKQFPKHTIHLLYNGLTSGDHKSAEHRDGKAIDFYLQGKPIKPGTVVYAMIKAGFSGIGVYYNKQTNIYSYHGDIGRTRMWSGHKSTRSAAWKYKPLIIDPKKYEV